MGTCPVPSRSRGKEAPSAGLLEAVEDRAGAVWGRVRWVARPARQIIDREYRFVSPDFRHGTDGLITRLNARGGGPFRSLR
ncbi:phage protease [Phyllobacterium sp. 0TCS1.6A]|uniref:phage protease n=1 Tax=unclassified Phyllobacterium TaxID=2638441 RepID=UPI003A5C3684